MPGEDPPTPHPLSDLLDALASAVHRWIQASDANRRLGASIGQWLTSLADHTIAAVSPPPPPQTPVLLSDPPSTPQPEAAATPKDDPAATLNGQTAAPDEDAPADAPPAQSWTPAPPEIRGPEISLPAAIRLLTEHFQGRPATREPARAGPVQAAPPPLPTMDFADMARRCRLKSEGCQFALRRQRHLQAGGSLYDLKAEFQSLLERAGPPGQCSMWMVVEWDEVWDEGFLEQAAAWYAVAESACLLATEYPDCTEREFLECLAEAQSGLRACLAAEGAPDDRDVQARLFAWLRDQAREHQVYLPRFMSLAESADPDDATGATQRIDTVRRRLGERRRFERERNKHLSKARWHAARITKGDDPAIEWPRIDQAVAAFAAAGHSPLARELTDVLTPLLDRPPPEAISPALRAALDAAADRAADRDEDQQTTEPAWRRDPSRELLAARDALRGRAMVLVGGIPKARSARAIKEAFELSDLLWISANEHESLSTFEPYVSRADTALVVMMVRWSSHSYEGLRDLAQQHGKLYLRLTGGYNPMQIAHQFYAQHSDKLPDPQPA